LARVVATAEDVWQDREQARRFLTTPHPEIGGKTPLDAALTDKVALLILRQFGFTRPA
jgi:uncharacterized protein (DUF2384 family)